VVLIFGAVEMNTQ